MMTTTNTTKIAQAKADRLISVTAEITAEITGVGPESCVPDNDGAVDADIYEGGCTIGAVTLLPGPDGLDTWGSLDHWASGELLERLQGMEWDDRGELIGQVVDAVVAAHAKA